jgi:opacity protein-like surface antigen
MKKGTLVLAVVASAVLSMSGVAHAQSNTYLGLQFANQKISADGESDSESFAGLYGGIKSGSIAYEAAISQKSINGLTYRIVDGAVNPHFPINDKIDVVTKIGMRFSSFSLDNVSVSGTSVLIGAGVQFQLAEKVSARLMFDYAPRAFGEKIKNTSMSAGVAYHF